MRKRFSQFAISLLYFIFLAYSRAEAQVNLIHFYNEIGKAQENQLASFIVVSGDPKDIINNIKGVCSQAEICLIRGHQSWTEFGQKMARDLESAAQAAKEWKGALDSLDLPSKKIYFEPWNEPDRDYECGGKTGEDCAKVVGQFIDALLEGSTPPYIVDNIILTTPAIDLHSGLQGARFEVYSSIIKQRAKLGIFGAVSVHAYSVEAAKNYSSFLDQLGLTGKPVFFSEIGALKENSLAPEQIPEGELISYLPGDLCNEFCSRAGGLINFLRNRSDIKGWALFSRSPGNYSGPSFTLWDHPCVIEALKGNCPCQCGPVSSGKKGLAAPNCQINLNEYRHCQWASANPVCPEILPQFGNCIMDQAQKESEQTILSQKERYRQNTKIKFDFEGNIASPPGEENSITQEFTGDGINAPLTKVIGDFFLGVASIFFRKIPDQIFFLTFHQPWRAITTMQLPITHRLPWNLVRALKNDFIHSILEEKSHDIIIGYANLEENNKVFCSAQPVREISRPVYASEIGCSNQTKSFEKIIIQSDGSWEIVSKPLTQQQLEFCDKIYGLGHLEAEKITGGSYREKYKDLPEEILQFCEHYSANRLHALAIQALGGIIPSMTLSFTEAAEGGMPKPGPGYGALADSIRPAINPVWKVFLPKKQRVELEKKPHPIEATKETKTTIKSKTFAGQVNKLTNFFKNIKITFFNQETRKTVHPDAVVKNYDLFNRQKDEVDTFFRYFIPKKVQKDQPFTLVREKDEEVPDITDPNGDLFVQYLRPYRWQKLGI